MHQINVGFVEEICQWETMEGRCHWRSEVIVMTSARWGRMKTGRCLEVHPNLLSTHGKDPFLGCSENVLSIMDRKCSGRASCDVRIPDPVLDEIKPCYPDQTRYLEASYVCVKGLLYDETLFTSISICVIVFIVANFITAFRKASFASAVYATANPSVHPYVCPSHSGIVSQELIIEMRNPNVT